MISATSACEKHGHEDEAKKPGPMPAFPDGFFVLAGFFVGDRDGFIVGFFVGD
jgi:hypothetical protein